jgi:hypothetical protein
MGRNSRAADPLEAHIRYALKEHMLFAGNSLDKARVIFARPHGTERRWRLDAAGCRDLVLRDPR